MKARSGTPLNSSVAAPTATSHASLDGSSQNSGKSAATSDPAAADRVHDLSILRQPIGTSISGFEQVRQAYETGTDEIRHLLGRECDLIFECRVCRNIFRSLANFLSHKRIYCATRFSRQKHCHFREEPENGAQQQRLEADCTQIVQLEQDFAEARPTTVHGAKGVMRDLSSVIERLRRRESATRAAVVPDFSLADGDATMVLVEPKPEPKPEPCVVLQLDRIAESTAAVFQTVRTADMTTVDEPIACTADSIKTDVLELHFLQQTAPVAMLDEQGKAMPVAEAVINGAADETSNGIRIACDICQMQFETEKTLRLHINKNHVTSTYVYPCPSCTQTFLRPFAVMKHLNLVHKKSIRRLRQMRETILRRRTRISQIQVKGPSRELARLQHSDRAATDTQRVAWPDNYNGIMSETLVGSAAIASTADGGGDAAKHRASLCSFCGKSFERRAALSTHLKTCPVKLSGTGATSSAAHQQQLDMDESNSNSTDSFMAMLNREKSVQARIHEQESELLQRHQQRRSAAAAAAVTVKPKTTTSSAASSRAHSPALPLDTDTATTSSTHRRKRSHARKSAPTSMQLSALDMDFHWDEAELAASTTSSAVATSSRTHHPKFDLNAIDSAISSIAASSDATAGDVSTDQQLLMPNRAKKARLLTTDVGDIEQRPTDCTICDKKFANLSNLRRHVAMFHYREKKFACKLCAFRAFRKVDVLNHIGSAHRQARSNGGTAMGGEDDALLTAADATDDLVELIEVDKNKYSEERGRAVAAAVERMNERDGMMDMESGGDFAVGGALVEDPDGDDSRPEIIIPVLNRYDLDEIDFELIPMEEFTLRSTDVTANNSTAPSPQPILPPDVATPPVASTVAATTATTAAPATTTHRRQRGRPKGSGKSQIAARASSTPNLPTKPALPRRSDNDFAATLVSPPSSIAAAASPVVLDPPRPAAKGTKLIRHASSNSSSSEETTNAGRRPIRNRVKIANKDFVYDLSSLLKKETDVRHYAPMLGRSQQQKRKAMAMAQVAASTASTGFTAPLPILGYNNNAGGSDSIVAAAAETLAVAHQHSNTSSHSLDNVDADGASTAATTAAAAVSVPGAALVMAQLAVAQHRACFNRPPDMPAAHAIVPAKIIALRRSVGSEWHVINAPNERRSTAASSSVSATSTPTTTKASTATAAALTSRRASNEQLLDLLVVKRRDSLMDKYHTVAKQTQRRLHKTLTATATTTVATSARMKSSAASPATAARKKKTVRPADVDYAALLPRLLPFGGAHEYAASNGDAGSAAIVAPPPLAGPLAAGPPPLLTMTPTKQRLTAVERLAEIKQRNRLQETMRKLNISDDADLSGSVREESYRGNERPNQSR